MNRLAFDMLDEPRAPMRNFSDGPAIDRNVSLSSKSCLIWYFAWPMIIFALIALSGILATRVYYMQAKSGSSDSIPEFCSASGKILTEPFLQAYELKRGYVDYLKQPRSINFMGTYAKKNTLATLHGDMDLNGSGTLHLELGMDEITIDFQEGRMLGKPGIGMAEELAAVCAFVDASVDPLLNALQLGDHSDLRIYETNIIGRSVYVAEFSGVGAELERVIYLDKQTLLPIEQINYSHSSGQQKYRYYNYMNVGGMQLSGDILWSPPSGRVIPIKLNELAMQ